MSRPLRRTVAVAHKELIHMLRDARVLFLALGLPVVMLLIFGYAISTDVDHVPMAVVDQDGTRASRRLVESMVAGGLFVKRGDLDSPDGAEALFVTGDVKAVLVVPRGYERHIARGEPASAQLLVDGSDGTTATIAMGEASAIAQTLAASYAGETGPTLAGGPAVRTRYNPAMRSKYNIVPGVIALILAMVSALLTALAVAREWERGSMEQLFATPVGRAEIIVGKLVPYAGLGSVQTLLVVTLGSYLFDVPLRGSLVALFLSSLLFLLSMLGFGLFISIVTKSQLVSVQASVIASMLPALLLSGFLFPIQNMPFWLQAISSAVPARYYVTALRGVFLKGNGVADLAPEILALAAFATGILLLGVRKFKRRIL